MFSFSTSFERWHLPPVPSYVNKECIVELEGGWFSPYWCYWLIFPENSFMTRNGSNESSWWSDPFEKFWKLWNPFQERCDTHDILCNILRKWRVFWSPNMGLMRPPRLDEFISYFKSSTTPPHAAGARATHCAQHRHTPARRTPARPMKENIHTKTVTLLSFSSDFLFWLSFPRNPIISKINSMCWIRETLEKPNSTF